MKQTLLLDVRARGWNAKGPQEVLYKVDIDYTDLEALAKKAIMSKRGVSKAGPVTVTITKRVQIGGQP